MEACKADGEADESGGCRAVEDSVGGWIDPRSAGECAAESERTGTNKAVERSAGGVEGCGADMGERLMGASGAGSRSAG